MYCLFYLFHLSLFIDSLWKQNLVYILYLRGLHHLWLPSICIILYNCMMKVSQFLFLSFELIVQSLFGILMLLKLFTQEKDLKFAFGFVISKVYLILKVFLQEYIHRTLFNLRIKVLSLIVTSLFNFVIPFKNEFTTLLVKFT